MSGSIDMDVPLKSLAEKQVGKHVHICLYKIFYRNEALLTTQFFQPYRNTTMVLAEPKTIHALREIENNLTSCGEPQKSAYR